MILGVGTDIVDAKRIDKIYNKFNYNNIIQNTYKFKGLTFLSG